jgi:phosphoserine phosphatase
MTPRHALQRWVGRLAGWWQSAWRRWLKRGGQWVETPTALPPARSVPAPAVSIRHSATVVIPALNEASRIAEVVRHAWADSATAEVIVVDDSSIDDTATLAAAAGARVITSSMLGKGASMRDGLEVGGRDFVVYLDGDLAGLREGLVGALVRPLAEDRADFVKARFGRGGGRVTELTAKPMLKAFFPELAPLAQPLGGIVAARRELLRALPFEDGYGVDIGLLIDAWRRGARLAEVDIGRIEHDSQPLLDLGAMANEVARVIYDRARDAGRLHMEQIGAMYEAQRQAVSSVDVVLARRRERRRLLLLALDGGVTPQHFVLELARSTGQAEAVSALLEVADPAERWHRVAQRLRFVHRSQFERVARELPLRTGVVEFVNRLRRAGFMVGVLGDGFLAGAETVRKRVFADFAFAHVLQFRDGVCTGELRLHAALLDAADPAAEPCKGHAITALCAPEGGDRTTFDEVWAVGHALEDLALLGRADRAFVVEPQAPGLRQLPGVVEFGDFGALLERVQPWLPPARTAQPAVTPARYGT